MVVELERDEIRLTCNDYYDGRSVDWPQIARTVADQLIPGQDLEEYVGELQGSRVGQVTIDRARLDRLNRVTRLRQVATAIVAPAVQTAAARAVADHWTLDELVTAIKAVVKEYRPRVHALAANAGR